MSDDLTSSNVDVVFRKDRGKDGQVFALIVNQAGTDDPRTCSIFTRDGHTHGSYQANMRRSIPASPAEALALRRSMESNPYGYIVHQVERGTRQHYNERLRQTSVSGIV